MQLYSFVELKLGVLRGFEVVLIKFNASAIIIDPRQWAFLIWVQVFLRATSCWFADAYSGFLWENIVVVLVNLSTLMEI